MNTVVVRPTRVRTAGVRQQLLLTAQQRLLYIHIKKTRRFQQVGELREYFL